MAGRLILATAAWLVFIPLVAGLAIQRLWLVFRAPASLAVRAEQPRRYWVLVGVNVIFLAVLLGDGVYAYWSWTALLLLIPLSGAQLAALDAASLHRYISKGAWLGLDGQVHRRANRPCSYWAWPVTGIAAVALNVGVAAFLFWMLIGPHKPPT